MAYLVFGATILKEKGCSNLFDKGLFQKQDSTHVVILCLFFSYLFMYCSYFIMSVTMCILCSECGKLFQLKSSDFLHCKFKLKFI